MMAELVVANDIGTTRVKSLGVYNARPGQVHRFDIDSLLGEAKELLAPDDSLRHVQTSEGEWFIGDSARIYSRNHIMGRSRHWTLTAAYRALHLYSIAQHVAPSTREAVVSLVTGLPLSDFKTNRPKIIESLQGEHVVNLQGRERPLKIIVQDVYVAIQGVAAIMAEGVQPGQTVAWLGIGGRNKVWATIQKDAQGRGRFIPDQTGSNEGGYLSVVLHFIDEIKRTYQLELSEHEAIQAMEKGEISLYGRPVDISSIVATAEESFVDSSVGLIYNVWTERDLPKVADFRIGGGGALAVGKTLASTLPQGRVVNEPRWTEAQGLLSLGMTRNGSH